MPKKPKTDQEIAAFRERARAIGDAYVRFATEHPAAYQLMSEISQVDESRYPELVRASRRARETMVGYVRDMIREGMMDGDADLIGYMFWSTLHGIVVLDMAGRLGGEIDADTLRKKTMRTLLAGMAVSPPRSGMSTTATSLSRVPSSM